MQAWWPTALGLVAGLCTSFSFVPQVIKAWRHGDTPGKQCRLAGGLELNGKES